MVNRLNSHFKAEELESELEMTKKELEEQQVDFQKAIKRRVSKGDNHVSSMSSARFRTPWTPKTGAISKRGEKDGNTCVMENSDLSVILSLNTLVPVFT